MVSSMVAQGSKRLFHVQSLSFGDHPFCLFEHNAASEGLVQLGVHDLDFEGGAMLEDGDRGYVSKRLRRCDICRLYVAGGDVEEVHGPDYRVA